MVTGDLDSDPNAAPSARLNHYGDVLTALEVATVLRISVESTYAAARRGDLPSLRFGRRVVFPKTALEALLAGSARARRSDR